MQDYLVIDIETVPDRVAEYQKAFPNSKKKPGFHAIISQVVAIGLSDNGQFSVLARDEFKTEKELLQWFADRVMSCHQNATIVGFNIKNFDLPVLQTRFAANRIHFKPHHAYFDIYQAIVGKWQTDVSACSLSELAWCMYGEAKHSSGADVASMWARGDILSIRQHCIEDVELTDKIYNDFLRGVGR